MLKAEGIYKIYRNGSKNLEVLNGINLDVRKGEALAIVGPSGAGKSTLLHILGGIDKPTKGRVLLNKTDLYKLSDTRRTVIRNKNIGFVFQFYHLLPEFSALENTMMPALMRTEEFSVNSRWAKESAEILLKEFGLEKRLRHRPGELSGGEQQRVAIARSLINTPDILLCDEPTGNLDSGMGEDILNILFSLNKKNNTTVVLVTHDREIAKRADRVLEIMDGKII